MPGGLEVKRRPTGKKMGINQCNLDEAKLSVVLTDVQPKWRVGRVWANSLHVGRPGAKSARVEGRVI